MTAIAPPEMMWLEITGKCQLECTMCYANSSPNGTHGTMDVADWIRVIDQAADQGTRVVQFIGGEPTLHPALPDLVNHSLARGLSVEVFSNLVHVTPALWEVFDQPGVQLACSYYSDDPEQHAAITGKPSYPRTKANLAEAVRRGIPLRAGVIDLGGGQRAAEAGAELVSLGVPSVGYDQARQVGRGACGGTGDATQLCGQCGDGVMAVGPDGAVTPCVMARWIQVGNVQDGQLDELGPDLVAARNALIEQGMPIAAGSACRPQEVNCYPYNDREARASACRPQEVNCYPYNDRSAPRGEIENAS